MELSQENRMCVGVKPESLETVMTGVESLVFPPTSVITMEVKKFA